MRRNLRAALRGDHEAGLGLVLIIGVSVFVFTIAATAAAIAVNGITQSRNRTGFEASLALAETGIDRALSAVQQAYDVDGSDYPIPGSTSWCGDSEVAFPTAGEGANGVFSSEDAEKAWVLPRLQALVATCATTDELGQYVVLKPVSASPKYGKVYALAAMPSFAEAQRTRVVKTEYIFMPYRPTHAILAGGDLELSSSTLVTGVDAAATAMAGVHTNGSLSSNGNPTVYGPVTSTGPSSATSTRFYGNDGTTAEHQPTVAIRPVSASLARATTTGDDALSSWYDLCPNGDVRAYAEKNAPCSASATLIGTATATTTVRGWKFNSTSKTWIATRNALDGTYYAHEGNINMDTGNAVFPRMTLIAAAENPTTCASKRHGNITWDHYELAAPASGNIFMLADSDIVTSANFTAGRLSPLSSGMFIAGDQIQMSTSSQGAVGSVITANQCPTPPPNGLITTSRVQNPSVYFDPNAEAPFSSIITTALWLDYGRG
ncbi:MAG: hypothetical protein H5T80_05005 [Dietzia sp.]|nr:hypothetical protein [Dietzia sp.]